MDAAIFIRKFMKICTSYQNCDLCPLAQVYCQKEEVNEEELVSVVERWGKERTNGEAIVGMMEKMDAPYIRCRKNEVGQVEMILDASWWDAGYKGE